MDDKISAEEGEWRTEEEMELMQERRRTEMERCRYVWEAVFLSAAQMEDSSKSLLP